VIGLFFAASAACSGDDPRLSPQNLPPGAVGTEYDATVRAEELGGSPRWSLDGALPPGLESTVDGPRYAITGTPVTPGSFQFVLRAEADGDAASRLYRIVIGGENDPLRITTAALPPAGVGAQYQALLTAAGGTESGYQWTADGLPEGLDFRRTGALIAEINGTPTQVGESDVVFRVTDDLLNTATATLTLTVRDAASSLRIVTSQLPAAVRGQPYSASVTAAGGTNEGYFWFAANLPDGLSIEDGTPSGRIAGTPTQQEPSQEAVTVTVVDSANSDAQRVFTLSVRDPPDLVISRKDFPDAEVDEPYAEFVRAVGGVEPYTWSVGDGSLPTDVALEADMADTATIAGTPSEAGLFNFSIRVEDALGDTDELPVELLVTPRPLAIVDVDPPLATAGVQYATTFEATGGAAPFSWRIDPISTLPPGLSLLDSTTREVTVSGRPRRAGTFDTTVVVEDSLATTSTQTFRFVVEGPPNALRIVTSTLADATVDASYIANLDATGGTGIDYMWSVIDGELPDGFMVLEDGTPSTFLLGTTTSTGTFEFTIEVEDSAGDTDDQFFTLTSTRAD